MNRCAICGNDAEIATICGDTLVPMTGAGVTHVCSYCLNEPGVGEWRPVLDTCGGCCNHVLVDDGNTDDSSVAWCRAEAERQGHTFCLEVNRRFAAMTVAERDAALGKEEDK